MTIRIRVDADCHQQVIDLPPAIITAPRLDPSTVYVPSREFAAKKGIDACMTGQSRHSNPYAWNSSFGFTWDRAWILQWESITHPRLFP